nr:unnamed protein product [Naegleria fowleri]
MITPKFECTQNDEFVTVVIYIPHVKMTEMEYSIDNTTVDDPNHDHTKSLFRFYVKPYFLRLHFAQELNDTGEFDLAKYDPDQERIIIQLPKKNRGEYFENLSMITWLLGANRTIGSEEGRVTSSSLLLGNEMSSPSSSSQPSKKAPLIEVVESVSNQMQDHDDDETNHGMFDENSEDWQQQLPDEKSASELMKEELGISKIYYGFNKQFTDVFTKFSQDYINEIIDVPLNPEVISAEERRKIRILNEVEEFDPEHYLVDYINKDRDIKMVFDFKPLFLSASQPFQWSDKEQEALRSLPKKEFLISNEISVYCGLVDLLCSFAYHHRSFMGESNSESAWTICKMSSQLSWLEELNHLKETLEIFISRTCVYALYRNFDLCIQCIKDIAQLLSLGKEYVLRALLEIKDILAHTHDKYLLNKIYVDNYCIWIQGGVFNSSLEQLAHSVLKLVDEEFLMKRHDFLISEHVSLKKLEDYAEECISNSNGHVEDLIMTEQDKQRPLAL